MPTQVAIQLSDGTFATLASAASAVGKSPAEQIAVIVESLYGAPLAPSDGEADHEFQRLFGSVDLGRPVGIGNAAIDADLGREYGGREFGPTCGS